MVHVSDNIGVKAGGERGELLPVTVEQVSLEHGPALLLVVSVGLGLVLVVSVTVVPGGAVRFPGAQTDPAEVCLASLVLADHVVAAAVLLDGGVALRGRGRYRQDLDVKRPYLGTLLGVG